MFQLTEIWCLCVLISFNIAVLVDEMGFDKKKIVLKSVHTYYQEFILYLQEILLMFYM